MSACRKMAKHEACFHLGLIAESLRREVEMFSKQVERTITDRKTNQPREMTDGEFESHEGWRKSQRLKAERALEAIAIAGEALTK